MIYRSCLISPITWTIILAAFGIPVCVGIMVFAFGDDLEMSVGILIGFLFIALVWIYFVTLRVTISKEKITKASLFQITSVLLSGETQFRHRAEQTVVSGINISDAFKASLGEDASNHLQITIRDGRNKLKIGSAIKGIVDIRNYLLQFEHEIVLPATLRPNAKIDCRYSL